ncbi:MAG TPA: glycosyltransferase [Streptosporangiaceae bacterium]|nr:glycosyltransferase [Streptosporangiaceae bacterium]
MITAVGVVIPAHNEEELLPACLAALGRAAAALRRVPVHLVVVADDCDDATAQRAGEGGAAVVEVNERNVGSARDAGMREALRRMGGLDPASTWLATTDADSVVPPTWLVQHVNYAERGWDAVVGTVTVLDWSEHPPGLPPIFLERYGASAGEHPHVHGANLGFTGLAYNNAGGFAANKTAEDHALVDALEAAGSRILRTSEVSVVTSARLRARAPAGFSELLASLDVS